MSSCMVCKKIFIKFSFSIYDDIYDTCPRQDLIDLFGNIDDRLIYTNKRICVLCLSVVRTLNEFKECMIENLDPNCENALDLFVAFNEFKRQVNGIPFEADSDEVLDRFKQVSRSNNNEVPDFDNLLEEDNDELLVEMYSVEYRESEPGSTGYSPIPKKIPNKEKKVRKRSKSSLETKVATKSLERSRRRTRSATNCADSIAGRSSVTSNDLRYDKNNCLENKLTRSVNRKRTIEAASLDKKEQVKHCCLLSECHQNYDSFEQLVGHVVSDHGIKQKDVNFDDYKNNLEEYIEKESIKSNNIDPDFYTNYYPCLVKHCHKYYKSFMDLSKHKASAHNILAKYWCVECLLKFTSADDLLTHNKLKHSNINSYCPYCSEPVFTMEDLYYHLENHKYFSFPCPYCDKYFLDYYSLRQHRKIHDKERNKVRIRRANKYTIVERIDIVKSDMKHVPSKEKEGDLIRITLQSGKSSHSPLIQKLYESKKAESIDLNMDDESIRELNFTPSINLNMDDESIRELSFTPSIDKLLIEDKEEKQIDGPSRTSSRTPSKTTSRTPSRTSTRTPSRTPSSTPSSTTISKSNSENIKEIEHDEEELKREKLYLQQYGFRECAVLLEDYSAIAGLYLEKQKIMEEQRMQDEKSEEDNSNLTCVEKVLTKGELKYFGESEDLQSENIPISENDVENVEDEQENRPFLVDDIDTIDEKTLLDKVEEVIGIRPPRKSRKRMMSPKKLTILNSNELRTDDSSDITNAVSCTGPSEMVIPADNPEATLSSLPTTDSTSLSPEIQYISFDESQINNEIIEIGDIINLPQDTGQITEMDTDGNDECQPTVDQEPKMMESAPNLQSTSTSGTVIEESTKIIAKPPRVKRLGMTDIIRKVDRSKMKGKRSNL